ncbi:MAG: ResA-like WAxxUGC motif-containing protein, partial [Acidimicrobiia bacterium]
KPEGACKGDICIPMPFEPGETVDVRKMSEHMGLPLVHDPEVGLFSLGPESLSSRTLVTAEAPELELPDLDGESFRLSSLRGQKIVLVAWAPY